MFNTAVGAVLPIVSSVPYKAQYLAVSALKAIADPEKGDMVALVGELTSTGPFGGAASSMLQIMMSDRRGRYLLKHQPRITDELLVRARLMPEGSLGRSYSHFMDTNQFTPSGRPPVQLIADPFEAYAMTRYREIHDFMHTLVRAGRTVEEELAVKILEYYHTGIPLGVLAVIGGMPHLNTAAIKRTLSLHREWAKGNCPKNTHTPSTPNFLCVHWEDLLERNHDSVLEELHVTPYLGSSTF
eukprot:Tbor_TRINITY_DN9921_c0_g1::TRINITY_DN9921_c0_g1_i1::g.17687::m.17687/K18586/COQ4; ubiquinone biosynthesis protein COQ4